MVLLPEGQQVATERHTVLITSGQQTVGVVQHLGHMSVSSARAHQGGGPDVGTHQLGVGTHPVSETVCALARLCKDDALWGFGVSWGAGIIQTVFKLL